MSVVLVFSVLFDILVCCVLLLKDFIQPFGAKVKIWTCFN